MEENKKERPLMTQEEFDQYIKDGNIYLNLMTTEGVVKYKSIRRAIRRGHCTTEGVCFPKRPFNNRKPYGREINEKKKTIYGRIQDLKRRIQ